jgi:mono/diheme cytochrome c family protein
MNRRLLGLAAIAVAINSAILVQQASGQVARVKRGLYLVNIGGCNDCHTAGSFLGKRDTSRTLAGSDVGFAIPGMGVFVGPNLTPDRETGLGAWTTEQIVTAIRTGKRPDGRMLAPVMPYNDFASMTKEDALAIAIYLKSLPAISNKVPGPFGPADKPDVFVMTVLPAPVYNGLPPPPSGK